MNKETFEDKLKLLVEEWRKRQEHYIDVAYEKFDDAYTNRKFTYKAIATRDCWKELLKLIEDEKVTAIHEKSCSEEKVDLLVNLLKQTTEYEVLQSFRDKVEQLKK